MQRKDVAGQDIWVRRLPPVVRSAYIEWMVNEQGWSRETRRTRLATIEHANGVWYSGGLTVRTVTRSEVLAFIGQTGHPRTRNRSLGDLRAFYRFAVPRRYSLHDPTVGVQRVREPRLIPRPLSPNEIRRLLIGAALVSQRAYTVVGLLAFAGLRREEAVTLTWGETDLAGATVRVLGKGSKERIVPMPPPLVELLGAWKYRDGTSAWVFPSTQRAGEHMSAITLWKDVSDAATVAKLDKVTPHRLRHSYATEVLRLTSDVASVQVLLGHASLNSTQIYAQVEQSGLARKVAPLDYGLRSQETGG